MPGAERRRRLRAGDAGTVIEIVVVCLLVRLRLAVSPLVRVLGPDAPLAPVAGRAEAEAALARLEWLVGACLSRPPLRGRCLLRALVLRRLLRRRGLPCQLLIEARPHGGRLAAHAVARVPPAGEAAGPLPPVVLG
jgi:hypothetical protein